MNLEDIEKGNFKVPLNKGQVDYLTLQFAVSNNAMINTLTNMLIEADVFKGETRDNVIKQINSEYEKRYNEQWASVVNAIHSK